MYKPMSEVRKVHAVELYELFTTESEEELESILASIRTRREQEEWKER